MLATRLGFGLAIGLAAACLPLACGSASPGAPAVPPSDSGIADSTQSDSSALSDVVAESAPADAGPDSPSDAEVCPDDVNVATSPAPDANLAGGVTAAECLACVRAACPTLLTVCNASCACKEAFTLFEQCVVSGGNLVTQCSPNFINAGIPLSDLYCAESCQAQCGYVASPDASAACDPVDQTGCAAGQACSLVSLGNSDVVPGCVTPGTIPLGGTCSSNACTGGNLCTNEASYVGDAGAIEQINICGEVCLADGDCKQQAAVGPAGNVPLCYWPIATTAYKICTDACNPVTAAGASGCATGLGCSYFDPGDVLPEGGLLTEATSCGLAGAGTDGASCTYPTDCAEGFTCVQHCRQTCRAGMNSDCSVSGETCVEWQGATMFGVCCPSSGC